MATVEDPRFRALHTDPRFARPHKKAGKVSVDARFAAVVSDPRFADASGRKRKREETPMAAGGGDGSVGAGTAAKRGRPSETLPQRMYVVEGEGGDDSAAAAAPSTAPALPGKDLNRVLPGAIAAAKVSAVEARLARLNRMARGEMMDDDVASESSTDDDADDVDEDTYAAQLADQLNADTDLTAMDAEAPDLATVEYLADGSETRRLALVNMDWDNLRAVDLLAALASFVPPGGAILRLSVYPSEFGAKRMAEEATRGPVSLLRAQYERYRAEGGESFAAMERRLEDELAVAQLSAALQEQAGEGEAEAGEADEAGDADEDDEAELDDDDADSEEADKELDRPRRRTVPAAAKGTISSAALRRGAGNGAASSRRGRGGGDDSGAGEFDPIALRAYELNRLKYYYAVVECDTVATAIALYTMCDGSEYELTSNTFDMRFVPDDTSFDRAPRDVATQVPKDYEPPQFETGALQHSKVELTWDGDDAGRVRALDWAKLKGVTTGVADGPKKKRKGRFRFIKQADDGAAGDDDERGDAVLANVRDYLAASDSETSSDSDAEGDGAAAAPKPAAVARAERRIAERARLRAALLGETAKRDSDGGSSDDDESVDVVGGSAPAADDGKASRKRSKAKAAAVDDEAADGSDDEPLMSITFTPGLGDDVVERSRKSKATAKESAWEAYQRKRREKRKAKKAAAKAEREALKGDGGAAAYVAPRGAAGADSGSDDDDATDDADDAFLVPSKRKRSGSDDGDDHVRFQPEHELAASQREARAVKKSAVAAEQAAALARLQLLTGGDDAGSDDDDIGKKGGQSKLRALAKAERAAVREAAKAARRSNAGSAATSAAPAAGSRVTEYAAAAAADPRFAGALSANPDFAIDPTAPQYKATAFAKALMKETYKPEAMAAARSKRAMVVVAAGVPSSVGGTAAGASVRMATATDAHAAPSGDGGRPSVAALAASVARKYGSATSESERLPAASAASPAPPATSGKVSKRDKGARKDKPAQEAESGATVRSGAATVVGASALAALIGGKGGAAVR